MSVILASLATALHVVLCFVGAPLLWGVVDKLHARMLGRAGPPIKQPYIRLGKLLRKVTLVPDTSTDMFTFWPLVAFLAFAVAIMLIPSFCLGMLTASASDYVTIVALFTLGRAAIALGGLETGSAFGGASFVRLALPGLFVEATLLVLLLVFASLAGNTNLNAMIQAFGSRQISVFVSMGFALVAMLVVAFTDVRHKPARDYELAMAEEAMELEYSARLLAQLQYARMLRLLAWVNLVSCLFLPFGMARAAAILSWPEGILLWAVKLLCLSLGLAVFSSVHVQTRLLRLPEILGVAFCLAIVGSLLLVVKGVG